MSNGRHRNYPEPLSFSWRISHSIGYILGGVTFVLGSICYIPSISAYVAGGWLFTVGSAGFLYADYNEWWKNNRIGCFAFDDFSESYESAVSSKFQPAESCWGKYQRAENGLNFAFSMLGSFLYLIGSICFIPSTNAIIAGTELFIYGSACIFLSQSWKLYRSACVNETNHSDQLFNIMNWYNDLPALGVDLFAGLGGLAYCIGSVYFLPAYNVTVADTLRSAVWFIVGGTGFLVSGLFLIYRYFCTLNYYH